MDARTLAQLCRQLAENKKAEDVLVLDLRGISTITDYFVIASGGTEPHLRAIVEELVDKVRETAGLKPAGTDGSWNARWIVLDYLDVIVHVMHPETRKRYALEQLWGDAPRLQPSTAELPTRG
ncbi:MAG: ribosome silencing factor [Verrucomicrobia bacterium]|nr:MAG: ribosome silencing factor [Verrucomicrobiota bacterium]